MRKDLPQQVLRELLKNSKQSDRDLAKNLNVSQPTITRIRHKLEREETIQNYTIIPNFQKMGFELLALTFTKGRSGALSPKELTVEHEEAKKHFDTLSNVIFVASGEGLDSTGVVMSFHESYTDYLSFLNKMRFRWLGFIETIRSFVISLETWHFKQFALKYLGDTPLKPQPTTMLKGFVNKNKRKKKG